MPAIFCFLILALIMGITIVEKNGQNMVCRENVSFLSYEFEKYKPKFIKFHFMGNDFTFNFK